MSSSSSSSAPADTNNTNDNSSSNLDDAQKLHLERMQKLNTVMGHLGYSSSSASSASAKQQQTQHKQQSAPSLDNSSLLSAKDVAALRKNMLHLQDEKSSSLLAQTQPEDSYIFAILRWSLRSVKASIESGLYHTQQAQESFKKSQADKKQKQEALAAQRQQADKEQLDKRRRLQQAEAEAKKLEEQSRNMKEASAEGRMLKTSLTDEEAAALHPKVGMIRDEIMSMEQKTHDTLDRVMKARLRFLTLSKEEPPCMPEMKSVADCYAQFAAKKYETAVFLEKEAATPDVVKRHQLPVPEEEKKATDKQQSNSGSSSFSSWWGRSSSAKTKASKFSSREQPDLPKDLLASEEVMKLSTSVLACRELAKKLEKCSNEAGMKHVTKNHGDQM